MINHVDKKNLLTTRQLEVLKLVAKGLTNDEIAEKMFITKHTVKAHICAIFEVLEVTSRVQAVTKGLKLCLLNPEDF